MTRKWTTSAIPEDTVFYVRTNGTRAEGQAVMRSGASASTDLGSSSNYSNELHAEKPMRALRV